MPKIDTTRIEGYTDMTPEEKLKALEEFEYTPDYTGYVKKSVFDTASSELAEWKKKYRETQSAEEQAKADTAERLAQLQSQLESMKREKAVSAYTAEYVKLGYDPELASNSAKALESGDVASVFADIKAFIATHDKKVSAEALKGIPRPKAGGGEDKGVTKESLSKMTPAERYHYAQEHPEEYATAYGNKGE